MHAQQLQDYTGIKAPCFVINLIFKNMGKYLIDKTTQALHF